MTELAHHEGPVPDLPARTVTALSRQARLQITPRDEQGKPPYEVVDAQPLMLLPDPDKGDLFFDFEGDPLWTADGRDWGLEYMFGVLGTGGQERSDRGIRSVEEFTPLWAHDRAAERKALLDFLAMVRKRRKRHPKMHIYHYAAVREDSAAAAGRALRGGRGRGRRPAAQRRARRPVSHGAQEHSGRHRELQPQVARTPVHGFGTAHR